MQSETDSMKILNIYLSLEDTTWRSAPSDGLLEGITAETSGFDEMAHYWYSMLWGRFPHIGNRELNTDTQRQGWRDAALL